MSASVSVLIPVYNNAASLQELHRRLVATLESMDRRFEIVFVNDGSADESLAILRRIASEDPRCVVLSLSRNFGQHPAINAGLTRVSGDITVLMDADLQDRPEELPRLLAPLDDPELDIVYTQFDLIDGKKSRLTSRLFHRVRQVERCAHPRRSAPTEPSPRGYERPCSTIPRAQRGVRAAHGADGLRARVRHRRASRSVGRKTSYDFRRRLSLAVSSVISYGSFLHRFVTWIGLSLTLLSGGYLVVVLIQYLTGFRALVNGQLLLLVITVLMSGVLLMTVGVLTAYTYRIFQEVLARPRFHVAREFGCGLPRDTA
ncbi:MAG: glycosyltransferase [Ilumatobacteraceae bacterium]